jgi:general secretion pathway protein K
MILLQTRRPPRRIDTDRGFALIAVLLFVVLLTGMALTVLGATRRHERLLRRSIESCQALEAADSAIRLMLLELGAPAVRSAAEAALHERTYQISAYSVTVFFDDEAGRIDLNNADENLLTAAFAANGFAEATARASAQRIIDWRDADDVPGASGAEHRDYRGEGNTIGPRNGRFATVQELRGVLGLAALPDEMLDAFTVYTHFATVRTDTVVAPVMRTLRWANQRRLGGRIWLGDGAPEPPSSAESGRVLRLRACIDGSVSDICRIAVVRLTRRWDQPAMVYAWYSQARFQ